MATPAQPPVSDKRPQPATDDDAPSVANDDQILEVYNQRHEFPLAIGLTGLMHALIVLVIFVFSVWLAAGPDRSSPPIEPAVVSALPDDSDGRDDRGIGSPGSGGDPLADDSSVNPTIPDEKTSLPDVTPPDPTKLPEVQTQTPPPNFKDKPSAAKPKGTGPEAGSGNTGQVGKGPGGSGVDGTRARKGRWQILFNAREGTYFKELGSVGAKLIFPVPGKQDEYYFVTDVNNPGQLRGPTPEEFDLVRRSLRFRDTSGESAREATTQLRLPYTPPWFEAVFPKQFEEELAAKEDQEIRNQKPGVSADEMNRLKGKIQKTVFRVRVHAGLYYITVKEIRW